MSEKRKYACIDVGTTKIKLNVYDSDFLSVYSEDASLPISKGLQDAEQLFAIVRHFVSKSSELGVKSAGLATYRASTVAWDKEGKPLTPIVTWTDRSVQSTFRKLAPHFKLLGKIPPFDLVISPYSPVMKFLRLRELNPNMPADHMEWTIDAYLSYRLTKRFVSDATNAALSGLVDPRSLKPIGIVRSLFGLKMDIPEIVENTQRIGSIDGTELNCLIADQQAASVAEGATERGIAKVTNGTGTFVDIPTEGFKRRGDLVPIILLKHKGIVSFGVEGYLPTTGVAVDMLRAMGILENYEDLEIDSDSGNTIFLPALAGLFVPHVSSARGLIAGLDMDSDKHSVITGLMKSIAFHVRLVLEQANEPVKTLRADGGLSKSDALLRKIAASTGKTVERSKDTEATSRGLTMLQMVSLGEASFKELQQMRNQVDVFRMESEPFRAEDYQKWKRLIELLRNSKESFLAE